MKPKKQKSSAQPKSKDIEIHDPTPEKSKLKGNERALQAKDYEEIEY